MDVKEVQSIRDDLNVVLTEVRKKNDEIEALKASGEEVDGKITDRFEELKARLDTLDTNLAEAEKAKKEAGSEGSFREAELDIKKALKTAIKTQRPVSIEIFGAKEEATPEQQKALSTDIDPNGGYWLKPSYSNRVRDFIVETSPLRTVATVETVSAGTTELIVPVEREDAVGAGWVAERGTRSETDTPTEGIVRIPLSEVYADPKMTEQIMLNPTFNTESWLRRKVADKIARVENTAFVSGTGEGQPEGFLVNANVGIVTSGTSSTFDFDDLITLQTELKTMYAARAAFGFKRTTLRQVRLIKDGNGRYIWEPSGQRGVPGTLLGDPVVLMEDMPTVASASKSIVYADWREFYTIADGGGLRLLIDPYTTKGFIEFYWRRYTGGAVIQPDAGKILQMAV